MAIVITSDTLTPGLVDLDERSHRAIRIMLDYWASRAVTQMRANASWSDRTTNARNGLSAVVEGVPGGGALVLYHAMPYGIWLEIRWSGRYAIIGPTLNEIAPQVLRMVGEGILRTTRL